MTRRPARLLSVFGGLLLWLLDRLLLHRRVPDTGRGRGIPVGRYLRRPMREPAFDPRPDLGCARSKLRRPFGEKASKAVRHCPSQGDAVVVLVHAAQTPRSIIVFLQKWE
jgi:hypothetical protein